MAKKKAKGKKRKANSCKRLSQPATTSERRATMARSPSRAQASAASRARLPSNWASRPLMRVISVAMPPGAKTVIETSWPCSSSA